MTLKVHLGVDDFLLRVMTLKMYLRVDDFFLGVMILKFRLGVDNFFFLGITDPKCVLGVGDFL